MSGAIPNAASIAARRFEASKSATARRTREARDTFSRRANRVSSAS